jgi:hypothetical protein
MAAMVSPAAYGYVRWEPVRNCHRPDRPEYNHYVNVKNKKYVRWVRLGIRPPTKPLHVNIFNCWYYIVD